MKNIKKNQIIVFVIALMLVSAGYLSYTTNTSVNSDEITTSTSSEIGEVNEVKELGSLGDAKLVNANVVLETEIGEAISEENTKEINNDENKKNTIVSSLNAIETNNKASDEYFSSSKLTRENMYSQMLDTYQKILENPNISADQKSISENEIKNINDIKNKIMICENLFKTKGLEESIVFVNSDSVNVIVKADKLEQNQIAQIQNIISREIGTDIENIHISTK